REVELAALRERTGASWLALPHTPLDLARAVDHALNGGDRPRTEVFLDLVHGIADEINNPLQFVLGYLQLLQLQLEGDQYQDARDHIAAALDGGQRIAGTVERLTRIERAAAGARRHERFDLRTALESALAVSAAGRPLPSIVREPAKGSFVVQGDAEILDPALHALAAAAFEFEQHGGSVHFVLTRIDHAVRLRMALRGEGFADWQLPRTWEPYYLCRVLRGSTQGLALFLVQTAIHAHRGQATARRLPDGAVAIDLELPRT
ncbi:MAG: histidine kinase dimerization/phospho-acceptor domain-containing protein, partial [Planctomycetota bacterium]